MMNTKVSASLLAGALLAATIGLTGCGGQQPQTPSNGNGNTASETTQSESHTVNGRVPPKKNDSESSTFNSNAASDSNNETTSSTSSQLSLSSSTAPGSIGEDAALKAALEHAGVSESDCSRIQVNAEPRDDDAPEHYDVEFTAGGNEYSYDIGLADGEIISYDSEPADNSDLDDSDAADDVDDD